MDQLFALARPVDPRFGERPRIALRDRPGEPNALGQRTRSGGTTPPDRPFPAPTCTLIWRGMPRAPLPGGRQASPPGAGPGGLTPPWRAGRRPPSDRRSRDATYGLRDTPPAAVRRLADDLEKALLAVAVLRGSVNSGATRRSGNRSYHPLNQTQPRVSMAWGFYPTGGGAIRSMKHY